MRYRFTARDLAPLRVLLRSPMARRAMAAAVPIKRIQAVPRHVEEVDLPVPVRGRDDLGGVPLPEILAAAQAAAPSVSGLAVRNGRLVVVHDRPPAAQEDRRLKRLLADRDGLRELGRSRRSAGGDALPDLERVLRDDATPDAEWLRAFRRYAVQRLLGDGEPR